METPERFNIDPDCELLENYLDGELSPAEVDRVERRLATEPELAAALGRMGVEYDLRRSAYQSLEPEASAADALVAAVTRGVRRADRRPRSTRVIRFGKLAGALAACVAISFSAGWVGRGIAARAATQAKVDATPADTAPKDEPFTYQVALTDEHGNITAVQKFDKLEDAREFASDVGRWQAQQMVRAPAPVVSSSGL